jgi:hypothetical protein
MDLSYAQVKRLYKKKKYKFCEGTYNLNIFGIRDTTFVDDKFNDYIGVAYEDSQCKFKVDLYKGTTDPSIHWLRNPLNKNGTAIMLEGQYRGCYKIGIHGRTGNFPYESLEQIGEMAYVRDSNKDDVLDIDPSKKITGIFKTNLHRCSRHKIVRYISLYSAGCQVIQDPKHFDELMVTAKRQVSLGWGDKFSYTLFNIKDFS